MNVKVWVCKIRIIFSHYSCLIKNSDYLIVLESRVGKRSDFNANTGNINSFDCTC